MLNSITFVELNSFHPRLPTTYNTQYIKYFYPNRSGQGSIGTLIGIMDNPDQYREVLVSESYEEVKDLLQGKFTYNGT